MRINIGRVALPMPSPGRLVSGVAHLGRGIRAWYRKRLRTHVHHSTSLVKPIFFYILAAAVGIGLGYIIYSWPLDKTAVLAISIPVALIIIGRPEYGVMLMFGMLCSIFRGSIVPKPVTISGMGLSASELIVGLLLLAVVARRFVSKDRGIREPSPMVIPVIAFMSAIILGIVTSYYRYSLHPMGPYPLKDVYNTARPLFCYVFFFIAWLSITDERRLKLLVNTILAVSAVVSILVVIQSIIGPGVRLFFGTTVITSLGLDPEQSFAAKGITRTYAPGASLMHFALPFAFYMSAASHKRWGYMILTLILGVGMIFTFTRNYWAAALLAMAVTWLASSWNVRRKLSVFGLVCVVGSVLMAVTFGSRIFGGGFGTAMVERIQAAVHPKTTAQSSFGNRLQENRYVIDKIKGNYLMGIGPMPASLGYAKVLSPYTGRWVFIPKQAIHNGWLELTLVYGLPGLLAYLCISGVFVYRSAKLFRSTKNPYFRAIAVSSLGAYIGFLLIRANVTLALLHEPENIIAISFIWGCIEALWRLERRQWEQDNPRAITTTEPLHV